MSLSEDRSDSYKNVFKIPLSIFFEPSQYSLRLVFLLLETVLIAELYQLIYIDKGLILDLYT